MKSVSRAYNHICAPKYKSLGFAKSNLTFARINGDVLQVFTFKKAHRVSMCTVDFGIFPLCMPLPIFMEAGGYELDTFIVEQCAMNAGWTFDLTSDESVANCINSISQAIDLYLLPLFDACIDCKTALAVLIKLEELFDRNRKKGLLLRGSSDCAISWYERSLLDSRKYYMALKSRDLSYVQRYLLHQVSFYERKIEALNKPQSPKQPEIVKEKFAANLSFYAKHLERINSGDVGFFDELICSNETQMLEFLAAKYPSIYRTWRTEH